MNIKRDAEDSLSAHPKKNIKFERIRKKKKQEEMLNEMFRKSSSTREI